MTTTSEDDNCLICFEPVSVFAISKCGHYTCHRCYLRMRLLYKARSCKFCRADQNDVIFSETIKPYTSFIKHLLPIFDTETGVYYTQVALKAQVDKIMNYTCPQINCEVSFTNWKSISLHVTSYHRLYLCDICVEKLTMLPDEFQFYTNAQLKWHRREGDMAFRPADQSGFTGHVECKHCRSFFYGKAEFLAHSRHVHLECFLCKESERCKFFKTYEDLEDHFTSDHYICHQPTCLRRKFIVFGTRDEWKQHQLALHDDPLVTQMNMMHIQAFDDNLPFISPRDDALSERIPDFIDIREQIGPRIPRRELLTSPTPELHNILSTEQVRKFKRHCWNFNGDYINAQEYVKGLYEIVCHNNEHVKILLEREAVVYLSNKKRAEAKAKWKSYGHEINFPVLRSTAVTRPVTAAGSSTQSNNNTSNEPRQIERKEATFVMQKPKPKKVATSRVLRIVSASENNTQSSSRNSLLTNNNRKVNQEIKEKWRARK